MLGNILPPYHSLQELNLDWILTKIKNMLRFLPDDGAVGQILRRTAHGAEWSDEQGAGGSVTSVNGMQGAVVLDYSDVGALPDTYTAPVDSVNGQTGTVVLDASDVGALPDTYVAPVDSVNGQTGTVVLPIPIIDTGTFTVSSSSTGDKSGNVSFNVPFSNAPVVFAVWNERNNGGYFNGGIRVSNITTTGFSWMVNVKSAYNTNWTIRWVAFLV